MKSWKNFFPLFRCPACRRWLAVRGRSEYKIRLASDREVREAMPDKEVSFDESLPK